MKTTDIHLDSLEKKFLTLRGSVTALKHIDLEVKAGEFFVLLGPSGCGKSTLLNLIAGLEKPTSGSITFGNKVVAAPAQKLFLSPFERDVSMVFQSYALYPHMTIRENIAFPLTNIKGNKPSKSEIAQKVEQVAATLKITELLERKPSELSGGQRQRVAIGRAIVRQPVIFLMDEPLSNLDAKLRNEMRAQIKSLQQDLGITTIYVTHDQLEAMTLGDRLAVINDGCIQQVGSPIDVYRKPVNTFIARFMGSPPMNIVSGSLHEQDGRSGLQADKAFIELPSKTFERIKSSGQRRCALGIRPEDIELVENGKGHFNSKPDFIENIGAELLLQFSALSEESRFIVKSTQTDIAKDVSIGLRFPEEKLHVFADSPTGERL